MSSPDYSKVACIVPALNVAATVRGVVTGLRRSLPGACVVGVDDGSSDGTRVELRRVCDEVIAFDQNRGKGAALRAGFASALEHDADSVLTIDSDGQHDPAFAPRLLAGLVDAHMVIGTRELNTITVPPHRRVANLLSSAAMRAVSRCGIRDSQSGYRAIRAEVVRTVAAQGDRYEYETDFLIRAARAGFVITEVTVPTIYGPVSNFREISDAWRVTCTLWGHRAGLFR